MSEASLWVQRYIGGVAHGSRVLDVACGQGRHIELARALGFNATGVDRDISTARRRFGSDSGVSLVELDLEVGNAFPFERASFGCVIVTNYLWRPILPDIVAAVSPVGMLLYETFRTGNERYGRPSNSNYLLQPGELVSAVAGKLVVIAYEDVTLSAPDRVVQRICAVGGQHPWIFEPPAAKESRTSNGGPAS